MKRMHLKQLVVCKITMNIAIAASGKIMQNLECVGFPSTSLTLTEANRPGHAGQGSGQRRPAMFRK